MSRRLLGGRLVRLDGLVNVPSRGVVGVDAEVLGRNIVC